MQTPMDAVFEGMGYDEYGHWHSEPLMDYWRWGFSDLDDARVQSTVADLLAKVCLGVGPGYMTADELRILRASAPMVEEMQSVMEARTVYDA